MSRRGVLDLCIHVRSASTVSAKSVRIASSLRVRHAETLSDLRCYGAVVRTDSNASPW